jgi:histidine triad (HIT) family protein
VADGVDGVLAAIDSADCPFCARLATTDPRFRGRGLLYEWSGSGVVAFEPLGPITPGHLLVVPRRHVEDASSMPVVTANVMHHAALVARDCWPCNIITSCGADATQSVFHLHVHVVPRRAGDGLKLPWTDPPVRNRNTGPTRPSAQSARRPRST